MKSNKRIEWIDYLKAFACFLVCLGHLIQSLQKANIDNYINITTFINWFIYLFHMPLFMCMSGFLYCKNKKEFSWKNYKDFELKKIINLLVPYFTFYLIYVGINIIFSSSVNTPKGIKDIIGIFNNPISPYWFLYALLAIFIIIPILEKICKNNEKLVFIILFIFKIAYIFIQTPIFAINQIMSYGIYFYVGCFINKENKKLNFKSIFTNILYIVMYVIFAIIFYRLQDNINEYIANILNILFAMAGIYICVSIFKTIQKSKILDTFKKYTFQIFVLHTIFAAGIRIVLFKVGINNYLIHFVFGIFFSIYIPVIVSIISDRIKYTNFFFYPVKTINELKEK